MPRTILVVDDDVGNRQLMTTMLETSGYEVVEAGNGEEALEMLFGGGKRFDAVVLDILMSKLDGLEVARRLRADEAAHHLAIVCVSALANSGEIAAGLAAGCDSYVTKPYRRRDLLEALDGAIRRRGGEPGPV